MTTIVDRAVGVLQRQEVASAALDGAANRLFIDALNVAESGRVERIGGAGGWGGDGEREEEDAAYEQDADRFCEIARFCVIPPLPALRERSTPKRRERA
jgi:hypothetical protein